MGARLVGEALLPMWSGLTSTERLVHITMAYSALDETSGGRQGRIYYGGHAHLVLAVTGATDASPGYAVGRRKIVRALAALEQAGAIARIKRGANGRRAVYELLPWRPALVDNPLDKAAKRRDQSVTSDPVRASPVTPYIGTTVGTIRSYMRTRDKQTFNAPSAREDVDNTTVGHPSRSGLPGVKIKDAATGAQGGLSVSVRRASLRTARRAAMARDVEILASRGEGYREIARVLGISPALVWRLHPGGIERAARS